MINFRFAHRTAGEEAYSSSYEAPRSKFRGAHGGDVGAIVLRTAFRDLFGAIRRWSRARRTAAELARLDDRMLRDIGLSRDEIVPVARGLAARQARRL